MFWATADRMEVARKEAEIELINAKIEIAWWARHYLQCGEFAKVSLAIKLLNQLK